MTQNRNLKRQVRVYMAEHNLSYTHALREILNEKGQKPTSAPESSQQIPGPPPGNQTDFNTKRQQGMKCGRCDQWTGDNNQGHYWSYCKVTKKIEVFHFCCPNDCQLVAIAEGRETHDNSE